jgi:hypothetical protein
MCGGIWRGGTTRCVERIQVKLDVFNDMGPLCDLLNEVSLISMRGTNWSTTTCVKRSQDQLYVWNDLRHYTMCKNN